MTLTADTAYQRWRDYMLRRLSLRSLGYIVRFWPTEVE